MHAYHICLHFVILTIGLEIKHEHLSKSLTLTIQAIKDKLYTLIRFMCVVIYVILKMSYQKKVF